MRLKKFLTCALACILSVTCLNTTVGAVDVPASGVISLMDLEKTHVIPSDYLSSSLRAYGTIDATISPGSIVFSRETLYMEARETVTINCSYNPAFASVDFGLVDSDSVFHYINVTGGSINETISIAERGAYTLGIRNKSPIRVSVVGFLNY